MESPVRRDRTMGDLRAVRTAPSVALSGTPGTGKSTVAQDLRAAWKVLEVAELAGGPGRAPSPRRSVRVDLKQLRAREARRPRDERPDIYVGHLAHLLPCHDVVVLRCHPLELARRLERARRGSVEDRRENVAAEATDVVLIEAISLRRRIWEVDTSRRSPQAVAREVARLVQKRPSPHYGHVNWLADPRVTDYLLHRPR